jgi:tetratricopeptide (TPR) repeat protein
MGYRKFLTADYLLYLYSYCAGRIAFIYKDHGKALAYFKRCCRISDSFDYRGKLYEYIGVCYFKLWKLEKAKFFLLKALEFRKNPLKLNSGTLSCLGIIYYREDDFSKARRYLELAKEAFRANDVTDIHTVRQYLSYLACFT